MKRGLFSGCSVLIFLVFVVLQSHPLPAQNANAIQEILDSWQSDKDLEHALWGVKAVNLASGKTVASYSPEKSLTPASVMKVVTSGVGFLLNKTAKPFETELQYTGTISDSTLYGNLIVYGKGDPTLGSARFKIQQPEQLFGAWTEAVYKQGIHSIKGDIIIDDSWFNGQPFPDGWTWGDIGNYFGAGVHGVCFMDNEYKITFEAGSKIGDKAVVSKITPEQSGMELVNNVVIAAANTGDRTMIYSAPNSNTIYISGTIPANKKDFVIRGAVQSPPLQLGMAFVDYLKRSGISLDGATLVRDVREPDTKTFYIHNPITYGQVAYWVNMRSINFYAESLLCSFSHQRNEKSPYNNGIDVVDSLLAANGVPVAGFRMADGSGLSRSNYVSPAFLCDFLKVMYASDAFPEFRKTLPIAGSSGTLAGLCKGSLAENNLCAKSGSMGGVRAYAGYVENRKGETICFSVIFNNFDCKQSALTKKIEALFAALAESD